MTMTITVTETIHGFSLLRSDGEQFSMTPTPTGSHVLSAASAEHTHPGDGGCEYDPNISKNDKLTRAREWALAYRRPDPGV